MEPSVHFDKSKQKTCDSIPIGIFQISMPSFHYKYFEMQLPRVESSCGWRFMSFFRKIMLDRGTHTSAQKRRTTPWGPSVCVGVSLSDHSVHEVDQITLKKKKRKRNKLTNRHFYVFVIYSGGPFGDLYIIEKQTLRSVTRTKNGKRELDGSFPKLKLKFSLWLELKTGRQSSFLSN